MKFEKKKTEKTIIYIKDTGSKYIIYRCKTTNTPSKNDEWIFVFIFMYVMGIVLANAVHARRFSFFFFVNKQTKTFLFFFIFISWRRKDSFLPSTPVQSFQWWWWKFLHTPIGHNTRLLRTCIQRYMNLCELRPYDSHIRYQKPRA